MEARLTADQQAFVREAVASGRIHRQEDAGEQAMSLWEERERRRLKILARVDESEASLARGEGRGIARHEDLKQLVDDIRRRGIARLSAEQKPRASE